MDIGQILGNLGFDWRVALANLANFLVIVWVLKRFAFKPIEKIIKERKSKIEKGVEDAERASSELQMAEQTSQKIAMEARSQANRIIAEAQKQSEKIISESRAAQEEQAKQIMADADKSIQQEKQKMLGDLKKELSGLVIDTTRKFLKENMTKEKQEEIIKRLIK